VETQPHRFACDHTRPGRGTFPIADASLANPPAAYQPTPGESLAVIISGGNTTAVRFDRCDKQQPLVTQNDRQFNPIGKLRQEAQWF
jgi:hypothetical protein